MLIKSTNTTEGGGIQKKLQSKAKCKNNKCFSWVSAVNVLSLTGRHSILYFPKMPSNTALVQHSLDLLWKQLRLYVGYTPLCSCLQCPQLSELVYFLLLELSMCFYIFHRHRVCLVDHGYLIWSLYSCWEGFGSSSLATLTLGFNYGFVSTSACGLYNGICSWGCPGGFGCGGGAAAWVTGALAAPGTQGNWQLRQQEI